MQNNLNSGREPLLEMFIFESTQLLEQLEELLLNSEKNNSMSVETINEIFRIMHTIKGSAAMMAYGNISTLAHAVEDMFSHIREKKPKSIKYTLLCDLVLAAADFIKEEINKVQLGVVSEEQNDELLNKIKEFVINLKDNSQAAAEKANVMKTVENCLTGNIEKTEPEKSDSNSGMSKELINNDSVNNNPINNDTVGNAGMETDPAIKKFSIIIHFDDGCQMENIRAYTIVHNLSNLCKELTHNPSNIIEDPSTSEFIVQNGFEVILSTDRPETEIKGILEESLFVKSYELTEIEDVINEPGIEEQIPSEGEVPEKLEIVTTALAKQEDRDNVSKGTKQSLLSVNIIKLDKLLDLVGEIVITESMVTRNPDLEGMKLDNFNKAARQLRKLTDELQDIVMSIRMIPISGTFQKMNRIIRDMSNKLGKEADLITEGEDTEVDKNIIDHLADPLMHLIRNAMDHGIESVEDRIQKGKPSKGTVSLTAQNTGGDVMISVSDDGKGLDKATLLAKAKVKGLLSKPENEMSDKEIYSLILIPGFSTKENVSEFSGRGVGMDVVKRNIDKVGGTITIESVLGQGTTVNIKIPLTLAIVDGMEISTGNSVFTIPIVSIKESFKADRKQLIKDINGNEMIMIRGKCYPIARVHNLFSVKTSIEDLCEGIMIMVEGEDKTICLFADRLIGEQQVVVKPLPAYLSKYSVKDSGIGGCTILGDGNISLIIDVAGIINRVL